MEPVDLRDFVRSTLLEIFHGVRGANQTMQEEASKGASAFTLLAGVEEKGGRGVHFDVAVTTRAEGGGGAGASVKVAVVEARIGGGGQVSNEQATRIRFSVAVNYVLG